MVLIMEITEAYQHEQTKEYNLAMDGPPPWLDVAQIYILI